MNYRVIPMDAQTWRIEEIAQPVDSYMYLLTGSEKAMLIDTGYGGIDLPRVVGELTSLPVMVVNTHYHGDHVGGNPYFTEIYMHSADRDLYPRRQEILKILPCAGSSGGKARSGPFIGSRMAMFLTWGDANCR